MAKRVFKYPLEIVDIQSLIVPLDSVIRHVGLQGTNGALFAWVEVDDNLVNIDQLRTIVMAGTGHPLPERELNFITTVQMYSGGLVWHVYEALS